MIHPNSCQKRNSPSPLIEQALKSGAMKLITNQSWSSIKAIKAIKQIKKIMVKTEGGSHGA
ncbi:MAG: hypothetical protein CO094_00650 [Anaerolineae bacterium CG_4_9_14_3_um_filter_57_17]|nr:MAG: hypothetical protein AUK01_09960 [Anaerolineae bacterium CG2_30_57_67]PJB68564.1 MAG: hypothetical protein CO094_00650 [Anaerolineae bacterium CG_4_9_14_3_um_filter_57_17]